MYCLYLKVLIIVSWKETFMSITYHEVAYHSGDEPGFSASNAKFHRGENTFSRGHRQYWEFTSFFYLFSLIKVILVHLPHLVFAVTGTMRHCKNSCMEMLDIIN